MTNRKRTYAIIALFSLFLGLGIFWFGSGLIRNYGGDVVVVLFLYMLLGLIGSWKPVSKLRFVLVVSVLVEVMQASVSVGTGDLSQLFFGSTFDVWDIAAYVIGAYVGYFSDFSISRQKENHDNASS